VDLGRFCALERRKLHTGYEHDHLQNRKVSSVNQWHCVTILPLVILKTALRSNSLPISFYFIVPICSIEANGIDSNIDSSGCGAAADDVNNDEDDDDD
jgi:hypothetical protein